MSAMPHPRPALELVTNSEATDDWAAESVRAESVLEQWEPEHQFVGSLLWLTAEQARPLIALVPASAIWKPVIRWAYELITEQVAADADPNPVLILAAARRNPGSMALDPDQPAGEQKIRQLSLYLYDAYSQAVAPVESARGYAREVLDETYRKAFATCGARMQELAEAGAGREQLTLQFTAIRDQLADLWKRAEAADPGSGQDQS